MPRRNSCRLPGVRGRAIYLWAARHMQETPAVREAWKAKKTCLWHGRQLAAVEPVRARTAVTTPTNATPAGAYILGEHRYFTDWVEAQDFPLELLLRS